MAFAADLWALDAGGGVATPPALARGVPVGGDWLLYRPGFPSAGAGGAAGALYANVSAAAAAGAPAAGAAATWGAGFGVAVEPSPTGTLTSLPPCALRLTPASFSWVAAGAPAEPLVDAAMHVVTGTAGGGAGGGVAFSLPAGALRPGWVYSVTATAAVVAGWSWDCSAAPWAGAFPGVGGGGRVFDVAAASPVPPVPAARAAPLLYVHAPPLGGGLTASPRASGIALITNFALASGGGDGGGWADGDAGALSAGRPSDGAAALAYTASLPLPAAPVATLWAAYSGLASSGGRDITAGQWAEASAALRYAGGEGCAALGGGGGGGGARPAWARLLAAAADALRLPPGALCASATAGAATALANEVYTSSLPQSAALTYHFRVDATLAAAAGSWGPLSLPPPDGRGIVAAASVATGPLQARLADPVLWPGAPLGAVTAVDRAGGALLTSPLPAPGSAAAPGGAAGAAPDFSGRLVLLLLVVDADGGVGVALANLTLPPSPASATLAEDLAAISAGDVAGGCNSGAALMRAGAASGVLAASGAPGAPVVVESLLTTTAAALACVGAAAGRGSGGAPSAGSAAVAFDDAALGATAAALARLSANSDGLGERSRAAALAAVGAMLALATPFNGTPAGGALPNPVPALPPAAAAAALSVLANVMASDAGTSTAPSGSGGGVALPSGGLALPTAAGLQSSLDAMHGALLRAAAPGDVPVGVSTAPPGGGAFCGAAVAITSTLIDVGTAGATGGALLSPAAAYTGGLSEQVGAAGPPPGAFSVPLTAPLGPCPGSSGGGGGRGGAPLPAAVAASAPPPTVMLPPALLAALHGGGGGGRGVSLKMVQWGVSPFNETAGLNALTYAPLPSEQALSIASGGALGELPAATLSVGGTLRRARALLARLLSSAASGALTASLESLPPAQPILDRLPSRPLDTRVVTVELALGGAGGARISRLPAPVLVTLPLRDPSLVVVDGATGLARAAPFSASTFPRATFAFTCPDSLAGLRFGGAVAARLTGPPEAVAAAWQRAPWGNATSGAALAGALAAGAPAALTLVSASSLRFNTSLQQLLARPPDGGGGVITAPGGGAGGGGDLFAGGDGGAHLAAGAGAVANWGVALTLSAPCGVLGEKTLVCGPGSGGRAVVFTCPRVTPVAACLYFNEARGAWATDGCAVAGVSSTAITCACTHLTPLAARFAALEQAAVEVFAADVPALVVVAWGAYGAHVALLLAIAGAAVGCSVAGAAADARAAPLYASALAAQPPVLALKAAAEGEAAAEAAASAAAARAAAAAAEEEAAHFGGARRGRRAAAAAAAAARTAPASPPRAWTLDVEYPSPTPLAPDAPPAALLRRIEAGEALLGVPYANDPAQAHAGCGAALWHRAVSARWRPRGVAGGVSGGVAGGAPAAPPTPAAAALAGQFALLMAAARGAPESPAAVDAVVVGAAGGVAASRPSTAGDSGGGGGAPPPVPALPILQLASLLCSRLRWTHALGAVGPWHDPRSPRPSQWAAALGFDLLSTLFLAAWGYAYLWGRVDARTGALLFPTLSSRGALALGAAAALAGAAVAAAARAALAAVDRGEWAARFPDLARELASREAAQALLASLPLPLLREQEARLRTLAGVLSASGPHPPPHTQAWDTNDAERAAGWARPPPLLVAHAPALLTACGRHPAQRIAFLLAAREAAEEALWAAAPPEVAAAARRGGGGRGITASAARRSAAVAPAQHAEDGDAGAGGASARAVALVHAWAAAVDGPAARARAPRLRLCSSRAGGDGDGAAEGAPAHAHYQRDAGACGPLAALGHAYHLAARLVARTLAAIDGAPPPRAPPEQRAALDAARRFAAVLAACCRSRTAAVAPAPSDGGDAMREPRGGPPLPGKEEEEAAVVAAAAAEEEEVEEEKKAAAAASPSSEKGAPRRTADAIAGAWVARHAALHRRGAGCCESRRGVAWRPGGCLPRSALVRCLGVAYLTFAAVFVLLFGRVAGEAVVRSLVAAFAVAVPTLWLLLPVARVGASALYHDAILPRAAAALAWVPWFGRASGALDALHLAAAAPALEEEAVDAAAARGAEEAEEGDDDGEDADGDAAAARAARIGVAPPRGAPLQPGALAVLRDASGGPLAAPLRAALLAASAVASADTLPLRHVPAFVLACSSPRLRDALALVLRARAAAAPAATSAGGAALAAARAALAQLRLRHALTTSIFELLRGASGKLAPPPPPPEAPASPPPRRKTAGRVSPPPPLAASAQPPAPSPPLLLAKAEHAPAARGASPPPAHAAEPGAPSRGASLSGADGGGVSTAAGDADAPGSFAAPATTAAGGGNTTDKEIAGLLRELEVVHAEYEGVKSTRRSPPLLPSSPAAASPRPPLPRASPAPSPSPPHHHRLRPLAHGPPAFAVPPLSAFSPTTHSPGAGARSPFAHVPTAHSPGASARSPAGRVSPPLPSLAASGRIRPPAAAAPLSPGGTTRSTHLLAAGTASVLGATSPPWAAAGPSLPPAAVATWYGAPAATWGGPPPPAAPLRGLPPPLRFAPPVGVAPFFAAALAPRAPLMPLPLARPLGQNFGPLGPLGMTVFPAGVSARGAGVAPRLPPPRLLGASGVLLARPRPQPPARGPPRHPANATP